MELQSPYSLVFQITQKCPFRCEICHRRYIKEEKGLSIEQRKEMIDILKKYGLRRLTVTGGEPTMLGEELFDLLKHIHQQKIHTCLSTNGYQLNEKRIEEMDEYVDQLLLPIRSLNQFDWKVDFGNTRYTLQLFKIVISTLQWIKTTGIILEISTVVHKKNMGKIIDLGWQLFSLNPNIYWRIEEYYPMGIRGHLHSKFEIESGDEFDNLCNHIKQIFGHLFRRISFSKAAGRINAPDFLITPKGDLITTSNKRYGEPVGNILCGSIPPEFKNRRSWSDYQEVCRDWGWGDV